MSKVDVFNRFNACKLKPEKDTVVISITRPEFPAPLDWGWGDILRLEFDDILPAEIDPEKGDPNPNPHNYALFTEGQAESIVYFVERYPNWNFMVHCDAGVSRSVAVGAFIAEIWDKELVLHEVQDRAYENGHVRALLRRVLNKRFYGNSITYKGE